MDHSFNVEVAKILGVAPAIIFNNIYWWVEKNRANEKHFYDGYYWTYNSKKAYCTQFPYFSERQIDYALRKLIDEGLIITGNYNKSPIDRTLWYAVTKKGYAILQKCKMENTELLNANNKNVQAIPDSKPDSKKKVSKKDEGKRSYEDIINSLVDAPKVKEALQVYLQMRMMQKRAPSNKALILLVERLKDLSQKPEEQVSIVNQSIRGGYPDFYSLKKPRANNGKKSSKHSDGAVSKKWSGETAKDANGKEMVF